jgi:hypothetical protein
MCSYSLWLGSKNRCSYDYLLFRSNSIILRVSGFNNCQRMRMKIYWVVHFSLDRVNTVQSPTYGRLVWRYGKSWHWRVVADRSTICYPLTPMYSPIWTPAGGEFQACVNHPPPLDALERSTTWCANAGSAIRLPGRRFERCTCFFSGKTSAINRQDWTAVKPHEFASLWGPPD